MDANWPSTGGWHPHPASVTHLVTMGTRWVIRISCILANLEGDSLFFSLILEGDSLFFSLILDADSLFFSRIVDTWNQLIAIFVLFDQIQLIYRTELLKYAPTFNNYAHQDPYWVKSGKFSEILRKLYPKSISKMWSISMYNVLYHTCISMKSTVYHSFLHLSQFSATFCEISVWYFPL